MLHVNVKVIEEVSPKRNTFVIYNVKNYHYRKSFSLHDSTQSEEIHLISLLPRGVRLSTPSELHPPFLQSNRFSKQVEYRYGYLASRENLNISRLREVGWNHEASWREKEER